MRSDSAGAVATACRHKEIGRNTGSPDGEGVDPQPELREEMAGPFGVAERLVVATKPGNAGGAKGPQFWRVVERDKGKRLASA